MKLSGRRQVLECLLGREHDPLLLQPRQDLNAFAASQDTRKSSEKNCNLLEM